MKKLTNYFFAVLAATVFLFTSCADDEETDKSPMLDLKGGDEYVSSDVTLTVGEPFTIGITASSNASTAEKLVGLTVVATSENIPTTLVDSTLDKLTTFNMDLMLYAPDVVGTARIVIEITDKAGETAQKTINITTEAGALDLKTFDAVIMGAVNNAAGSTASLFTGTVYKISGDDAKNNSEKVDIVYYFGSKEAALYAPTNSDIQDVSAYGISSWATKNNTKLSASTLTVAQFDAIATDKDLEAAIGTASDSFVGFLAADDIVEFETADGKKGVFKVAAITTGNSGSITISVKVEQ